MFLIIKIRIIYYLLVVKIIIIYYIFLFSSKFNLYKKYFINYQFQEKILYI